MQKILIFFFSKNISVYAISYDQRFNYMLTNDIISFEQLGPDVHIHNIVKKQQNARKNQFEDVGVVNKSFAD